MKKIATKLAWLCLCLATPTFADSTSDVAALLNNVKTMRANFVQTVYDNRNKAMQQSIGRMAMQRPGKFRWDVTKPIPQLIVANQSRLWIYDPDLEQVTIRSLAQATGETPALLLSDVDNVLDKDFKVQPLKKGSGTWFKLIPKKADSMFAWIELGFTDGKISEMRLQDHLGHVTSVKFKNIETNVALSANLFVFKTPANVDVINETRKR
ncbi:MAG: outer membrane lipoprotein chaperone LolA [Gammaproteobacteria bacterium]